MSTITTHKKELYVSDRKPLLKIGKKPFVVFPLNEWRVMEEKFEDLEMRASQSLINTIAKRRKEKKVITLDTMFKKYGI